MTTSQGLKVYFDTSVYVAIGLSEPGKADLAEVAVGQAQQGRNQGFISSLVVAEAVGCPRVRAPQGESARVGQRKMKEVAEFLLKLNFTYGEGGMVVARWASELCREFDLRGPDALHLALALHANCDELHTFDGDLLKVAKQAGAIVVTEPRGVYQGQFDFS